MTVVGVLSLNREKYPRFSHVMSLTQVVRRCKETMSPQWHSYYHLLEKPAACLTMHKQSDKRLSWDSLISNMVFVCVHPCSAV